MGVTLFYNQYYRLLAITIAWQLYTEYYHNTNNCCCIVILYPKKFYQGKDNSRMVQSSQWNFCHNPNPSPFSVIIMLILKTSLEVFPYNSVQCEARIKMKKLVHGTTLSKFMNDTKQSHFANVYIRVWHNSCALKVHSEISEYMCWKIATKSINNTSTLSLLSMQDVNGMLLVRYICHKM